MNHGWSPAHERVAALAFDKQAGSAQLETWLNATERKPPETSTATFVASSKCKRGKERRCPM